MTPEQQRKMLEAAAKACGIEISTWSNCQAGGFVKGGSGKFWNPLTNGLDTAEMCAKLEINHEHHSDYIQCLWAPQETYHVITMLKDHDNSRLKAWMFAATMVAAKIGGHEE